MKRSTRKGRPTRLRFAAPLVLTLSADCAAHRIIDTPVERPHPPREVGPPAAPTPPARFPSSVEQFQSGVRFEMRRYLSELFSRLRSPASPWFDRRLDVTLRITLDARGVVTAASVATTSGDPRFDATVRDAVSTLTLGPVPRSLLTNAGTADIELLVAAGAAEGVGMPHIRVVDPAADELMGLQLSVPQPGGLVVTNTTDHAIEVSSRLVTWQFAGRVDRSAWIPWGVWVPWDALELVESCEPERPPRCVTIAAGQSLTIVPWRFWRCGGQCLHGERCRSNERYSNGAWRYTVRACDESWEVAGPSFTPSSVSE